jgi:hypothetical protein
MCLTPEKYARNFKPLFAVVSDINLATDDARRIIRMAYPDCVTAIELRSKQKFLSHEITAFY